MASVQDHEVVAVDEVDEAVLLGDTARPRPGQRVPELEHRYRSLMEIGPVAADAVAFQDEVLSTLPSFWDERDVQHLHHPVWFHQFSGTAFAARDDAGDLHGYLLGALTPRGGYAHVIATLPSGRARGTGRALYARFAAHVAANGGTTVEAITVPTNTGSVAFHRRLGFTATLVEQYGGPGQDRVLFAVHAGALLGW